MKKNKFKLAKHVLVLSTGILFTFCAPPNEVEKITFLEKTVLNAEETEAHPTKREGDAHSGKAYWKVDSANIYGLNYIFQINDSLKQKDIRVKLNAWVRVGDLTNDQKYAVSLEDGTGNMINWSEINFRSHIAEPGKWINVLDSVTIPGNLISSTGMVLKTFSFNPNSKSFLDCDDVELSFYKVDRVVEK